MKCIDSKECIQWGKAAGHGSFISSILMPDPVWSFLMMFSQLWKGQANQREKKKKESWKAPKPQLFVLSFFLGFKWSCRELSSGTGLAAPHILLYHECLGIFWQNYHRRFCEFSLNHRIYPVRFGSSTGSWKRTFMRLHSTENLQQTTLAKYFKVILQVLMAQFFFLPAADALAAPVLFSKCKCSCHCLRVMLFFRV